MIKSDGMETTQFSKEYFFQLLFSEQEMENLDVLIFEKWVNSFTFFPLADMVLCKKYQQIQSPKFQKQLKYVASIVPSRTIFQYYMKGELKIKKNILAPETKKNQVENLPVKPVTKSGFFNFFLF